MSWNHRILAHKYGENTHLAIHEVYYDENNIPNSYTENAISVNGENLKEIKWTLNKMLEATKKDILWAGDNFPNVCKIKYQCELCGRDNFDKPTPHNCIDGYRKRGLKWKTLFV